MDLNNIYKYFLNLFIASIFIILNFIYRPIYSKDLTYLSTLHSDNPYKFKKVSIGADFTYLNLVHKGDYSDLFKKNRAGANVYVGYNLNGVMLEVGYSFTTRRAKEFTVQGAGATFLGLAVNNPPTTFTGKVRFKNTHLTLNLFTDLIENFKVVTAIGIGFVRPHTIFTSSDPNYLGVIESKTTMVPRVGAGFSLTHTENISFRTMFYFEQFSKIRYKKSPTPDTDQAFKNAYTASVGILFKL